MSASPATRVIYEQPLGERIRSCLRLEYLFARAEHLIEVDDPWASRTTLEAIIDVMALVGRSDLKKELINELERHAVTLEGLARNPKVDPQRLGQILDEVKSTLGILRSRDSLPGHELRSDELLSSVRQRSSIPAGTCDFDLPAYHYWLESPPGARHRDLRRWLSAFDLLRSAVELCLRLVRESAVVTRETASGGFFQRTLETSTPCHMVRVSVPSDIGCYPEISAGKHRFTVRFMRPGNGAVRPSQMDEDIEFELQRCVI